MEIFAGKIVVGGFLPLLIFIKPGDEAILYTVNSYIQKNNGFRRGRYHQNCNIVIYNRKCIFVLHPQVLTQGP